MISLIQKGGSYADEPNGWCTDITCGTGVPSESEDFEGGCDNVVSCSDERAVLLGCGGFVFIQQVGADKRFLAVLSHAAKPISRWAVLLAFLATALLAYLLLPPEGFLGGPLGQRWPVGDNMAYKGPTWRKDSKCTWRDAAKDPPYFSLLNPDMLAHSLTSSSAAFLIIWSYYFSPYLPLYGHTIPPQDEGLDESFLLTGDMAGCVFAVENLSKCRDTALLGLPLPIPRRKLPVEKLSPAVTAGVDISEPSARRSPTLLAVNVASNSAATPAETAMHQAQHRRRQEAAVEAVFQVQPGTSLRQFSVFSRVGKHCKIGVLSRASTTVVMGLWELPPPALAFSKNQYTYMNQFRLGLEIFEHQGVIMFADSYYMPLVMQALKDAAAAEKERGKRNTFPPLHSRVCIVPLELEELPYAFLGSHTRLAGSAAIRDPRVDVGWWNHPYYNEMYYIVQISKIALTTDISIANPYNSEFFLWLDPPKREYYPSNPQDLRRALDGVFLRENVKPGALLMQSTPQRILAGPWATKCYGGVFDSHAKYGPGIVGGIIGGTTEAFQRVFPFWDSAVRALISLSILNDEQHLHTLAACWFPSLFHVVPYHPACSPQFLCLPHLLAAVHPKADRSWDLQGSELHGPQPRETWKSYPFPVVTTLGVPEAAYVPAVPYNR